MKASSLLGGGLGLGLAAMLSACGAVDAIPMPAGEAEGYYDDVALTLEAALAVDGMSWELIEGTRAVDSQHEACTYSPGTWTPQADLPVPSDDEGWARRLDTVNVVLAQYGFEEVEQPTTEGGSQLLTSSDDYGATLTISGEGVIAITGAMVDADPCIPEAIGLD